MSVKSGRAEPESNNGLALTDLRRGNGDNPDEYRKRALRLSLFIPVCVMKL